MLFVLGVYDIAKFWFVRNEWSYSPTPLYVFMAYTGTTLHLNYRILLDLGVYDIAKFWFVRKGWSY
jgi:hypothetical protein